MIQLTITVRGISRADFLALLAGATVEEGPDSSDLAAAAAGIEAENDGAPVPAPDAPAPKKSRAKKTKAA